LVPLVVRQGGLKVSEISAYHEAGHAFMAIYVGACVRSVTIQPDWDDGPERHADTQVHWPLGIFGQREFQQKLVQVALAGPVAEMIYSGEPYHPGYVAEWAADWKAAWEAAAPLMRAERQRLAYLEQVTVKLYQMLNRDDHWAALAAIVDNLLAHETLDGDEVEDIFRQWLP
jgi:ATP-dependent Zn protease